MVDWLRLPSWKLLPIPESQGCGEGEIELRRPLAAPPPAPGGAPGNAVAVAPDDAVDSVRHRVPEREKREDRIRAS